MANCDECGGNIRRASETLVTQSNTSSTVRAQASIEGTCAPFDIDWTTGTNLTDIIYSSTEPTCSSTVNTNSIWIDTDDGNAVYTCSAGTWMKSSRQVYKQTGTPTTAEEHDFWWETDENVIRVLKSGSWDYAATKNQYFHSDSEPTSPGVSVGDIWYDTGENVIKIYTSSGWEIESDITKFHAGDINHIGSTAPSSPEDGFLWLDTSITPNELKKYDTSTSSWNTIATIEASWSGVVDDGGKPDDNADVTSDNEQSFSWLTGFLNSGQVDDDTLTGRMVNDGEIDTPHITHSAITFDRIDHKAVTETKIGDSAITTPKIDTNAIISDKIQSEEIKANNIDASAVTAMKVDANAISAGSIQGSAITAEAIASSVITAEKIGANEIYGKQIRSSAITTDKIDALDVTTEDIKIGDTNDVTFNFFYDTGTGSLYMEPSSDNRGTLGLNNILNLIKSKNIYGDYIVNSSGGGPPDFTNGLTSNGDIKLSSSTGDLGSMGTPFTNAFFDYIDVNDIWEQTDGSGIDMWDPVTCDTTLTCSSRLKIPVGNNMYD